MALSLVALPAAHAQDPPPGPAAEDVTLESEILDRTPSDPAADAPSQDTASTAVDVPLWLEVRDGSGRVPADLQAADLEVIEDGTTRPIVALGTGGAPARVVLYFDPELASSRTIKRAAESLSRLAPQLAQLGEVELVTVDEEAGPQVALRSRDSLALGERLSRTALTDTGSPQVLEIRRRTLSDVFPPSAVRTPLSPEELAERVTQGIAEELEWLARRQAQLLEWAFTAAAREAGDAEAGAGVLFLTSDGFDLSPVDFYSQLLDEEATRLVLRHVARLPTLESAARDTAQALAAAGWTVLPVSFPATEDEEEAVDFTVLKSQDDQGSSTAFPGVTVRPGTIFRRRQQDAAAEAAPFLPEPRFVAPLPVLRQLAQATGGELVASDGAARDAVSRLAARRGAVYRSPLPFDAGVVPLEVRARHPEWTVRARRWASRGVPPAVARVRLERLLAGYEAEGGFDVAAVLRLDEPALGEERPAAGKLDVRLDLRDLQAATPEEEWAALDDAVFRVSLAVAAGNGPPEVQSEILAGQELRGREEWRYHTEVALPAAATSVAVVVEELSRGHWGGRRATVVESDLADAGDVLPAPVVIEIQRPDESVLRGRVKFATEVYDPLVASVEFQLDDRTEARVTQAPFEARLDLGRTPRRRQLAVIAYDRAGAELGRDTVVINGGSGGLNVAIVRPESFRGSGPVDVEAEVVVPLERRLDRVLFFWNNEPVSTLFAPPFRQRINVPSSSATGYVRVVAMLDDGTTAEDVLFVNGPVASERLEVNLVELYVVVTDRNGRPVRGLNETDFRVQEDSVRQEIASFSDASTLPLTLGMAIDSSASMFVKLSSVQQAATQFLHSTFTEQDRAFIVDFDSEPRLARATTGDLDRLVQSITNLQADGRTALWESVVFSLVQLQGVRGRKALIVFSDGADEDDQFPYRTSLDVARKMGVPIYLILMRDRPKESTGLNLFTRSFTSRIDRLIEATGGRVFYAKEYDHLSEVYDEIEEELRSQYLLTYYPQGPAQNGAWRNVDVEVEGSGLTPRTLTGYWQ